MKTSNKIQIGLMFTIACLTWTCGPIKQDAVENTNQARTEDSNLQGANDSCNWCGISEAPANVSWRTIIPTEDEAGEKLIISGTVYEKDGIAPAPGIMLYVYHTNTDGVYPKRGDETGNGRFHGYLRAWMKTDSLGRYEFETIKPAPYQTHGGEPSHIHYTLKKPGYDEYWLTALWFADDPRVTEELLKTVKRPGGKTNVVQLKVDDQGVLRGKRDLILDFLDE